MEWPEGVYLSNHPQPPTINQPKCFINNSIFSTFSQYNRHLFVQLGGKPSFSDPLLEVSTLNSIYLFQEKPNNICICTLQTVDIRQILDKFPEKSGGLKDLYDKGPQNAFYLVKCWADLNTDLTTGSETGDFYGVTSQ